MAGVIDRLQESPLFLGMSQHEMQEVVERTKFHFTKVEAGKYLAREGRPCQEITILLSGEMAVSRESDDHQYRLTEQIHAPATLHVTEIFGRSLRYTADYRSVTDCSVVQISRTDVMRLLDEQLIFRLNVINIMALTYAKENARPYKALPDNLRYRIIRFITDRCTWPTGIKILSIKMQTFRNYLAVGRDQFSAELNAMQQDGILQLSRGKITIKL